MFQDNNSEVIETAISALKELVTHDDLPIINDMLQNENYCVNKSAVWVFEDLLTHDDLSIIKEVLNNNNSDVKTAAFTLFEKFSNEKELKELSDKIMSGEIINEDTSFNCLISLDEKFYSPNKKILSLHNKYPRE